MIKFNELRIGNLVLDSTKNTTVIESVVFNDNRVRYGIRLTEEWFERFGFIKTSLTFTGIEGYQITDDKLYLAFNKIEYENKTYGWSLHNPHFNTAIDYVHQLQNIFHSITGEELTIKSQIHSQTS